MNKIAPLLVISLLLSACSGGKDHTGERLGQAAGAIIGAVVGSDVGTGKGGAIAAGMGAILGALLGKELGRTLDEVDRDIAKKSAKDTLETAEVGESVNWSNPDSGTSGTYTPTSAPETENGDTCRDFESTVFIDGEEKKAKGRACRQSDGTWKIVE